MATKIYFFPLDDKLEERFPPITIGLLPDGTADISKLPADIQDQILAFGIQDPTHSAVVFPKDGELFLESLLESNNLYRRFRSEPEPRGNV